MPFLKRLEGKELFGEVKKVLDRLTQSNATFTKYDVTVEVRKNVGPEIEVLHSDVRMEVEDAIPRHYPNYVSKYNVNIAAFDYSPAAKLIVPNKTPTGYVQGPPMPVSTCPGTSQSKSSAQVFIPTLFPSGTTNALPISGGPTLTTTVVANKKGLCLPKRVVKEAAKSSLHGKRVYVDIKAPSPMLPSLATTYQPDQYGNATVLHKTLAQVYNGNAVPGAKYQVAVRLGTIEVTRL